jgi:site-specific DNA recombinase
VVQAAELAEIVTDAGESAKSLDRPGMERLLALVDARAVDVVIIAKLDRLTRSARDLAELLERSKRGVALVSVAESLDTGTAAGRLTLNIMVSVSQWEREAIGERTRDAMRSLEFSATKSPQPAGGQKMPVWCVLPNKVGHCKISSGRNRPRITKPL